MVRVYMSRYVCAFFLFFCIQTPLFIQRLFISYTARGVTRCGGGGGSLVMPFNPARV